MTYSFLNIFASIAGPGGFALLGSGAAVAEEGIGIEPAEDKNVMTIGADGGGQHALIASNAGVVTVRLLKTSPFNAILMAMYDFQSTSSALWGQNIITITDSARGDLHIIQSAAFKKKPAIVYDKPGQMMEWTFDSLDINSVLGAN